MSGLTSKVLAGAVLVGGALAAGCHHSETDRWHGDPCWPDRYENEARRSQVAAFEPQVLNGHILDQTIWNMQFDYGTDKLTGAGIDKLDQLARRRPAPDTRIFLQTARDIPYDAERAGDYATKRTELDTKRVAAIKKYLATSLTGRPSTFEIEVHDPAPPGIDGAAPRVIVPSPRTRAMGAEGQGGAGTPPGATPPGGTPPSGGSGYTPPSSGGSTTTPRM